MLLNFILDANGLPHPPANQFDAENQSVRSKRSFLRHRGMTITEKERTSMTNAVERLTHSKPDSQLEASVNEIFKGYLGIKTKSEAKRINQRTQAKDPSINSQGSPGMSKNLNLGGGHNDGSVFIPMALRSRVGSKKVMGRRSINQMNRSGIKFNQVAPQSKASIFLKGLEANHSLEK